MYGRTYDISFRPFEMMKEKGWTAASSDTQAQEGDFFVLAYTEGKRKGQLEHVGIVVKIDTTDGEKWSCVAGGAGGRLGGQGVHDGVGRTPLQPRPGGVMGWVNVDLYFDGWAGPDVEVGDLE